jgi:hypothetical protein
VGVKAAETRLLLAAKFALAQATEKTELLKAAEDYGKAKVAAKNSRDRWKARKRMATR